MCALIQDGMLPPLLVADKRTIIRAGKAPVQTIQKLNPAFIPYHRSFRLYFRGELAGWNRIFLIVTVQFPAEFPVKRHRERMQERQRAAVFIHLLQRVLQQTGDQPFSPVLRPSGYACNPSHRDGAALYVCLQRKQRKFRRQLPILENPPNPFRLKSGLRLLPCLGGHFILEGIL
ncbi:hypothetical protein D3C71_1489530 [compost metagenome]